MYFTDIERPVSYNVKRDTNTRIALACISLLSKKKTLSPGGESIYLSYTIIPTTYYPDKLLPYTSVN